MGGNVKGLNDYLQILKSPDIYPDIQGAGFFMSPLMSAVSTIIAFAGMLAMLLVLLRIGADVLLMAGAGSLLDMGKNKNSSKLNTFSSFKAGDEIPVGNPWKYMTDHGYKIILMLAFIGLMISGYLLPLAGTVTASIGAVITKVSDINPVPFIEALDVSTDGLVKAVPKSSISTLMKEYSKHAGNMVSAKQMADKSETIGDSQYEQAASAYYNSYWAAEIYSVQLEGTLHNAKLAAKGTTTDTGRVLSREEEQLRTFDYRAHVGNVDQVLLAQAEESKIYTPDTSLFKKAEAARSALNSAKKSPGSVYKLP